MDQLCGQIESQAARMATAARAAAATVLAGTAAASGAVQSADDGSKGGTGAAAAVQTVMALQLLQKLSERGLLDRHAAAGPLLQAYRSALRARDGGGTAGSDATATAATEEEEEEGEGAKGMEGDAGSGAVVAARLTRTLLSLFIPTAGPTAGPSGTGGAGAVADFAGSAAICGEAAVRCGVALGAVRFLAASAGVWGSGSRSLLLLPCCHTRLREAPSYGLAHWHSMAPVLRSASP